MGERQHYSTGTIWEGAHGYSRAVRVGDHVFVSGTLATDDRGFVVGLGNPYEQTVYIITRIQAALEALGASLEDVVRTRVYVVDMGRWQEVAKAHAEFFKEIGPASTLVEVKRLAGGEYLVEIEADALIGAGR